MSTAQIAHLQRQVRSLTQDEVFDSAVLLGSFMVSLSAKAAHATPRVGEGSHIESLVVFADALKAKGETKRAIEFYKQALSQRKNVRVNGGGVAGPSSRLRRGGSEEASTPRVSGSGGKGKGKGKGKGDADSDTGPDDRVGMTDLGELEASIKFRVARCQAKLKQRQTAIKTLESINPRYRSSSMVLTLANLYSQLGMDRMTVNAYTEGVRGTPYALHAIRELLRLGVPSSDVARDVTARARPEDASWLGTFCEAHGLLTLSQHSAALASFGKLNKKIPQQPHVLTSMGQLQVELNDRHAAIVLFQKARAVDSKNLEGMDTYASLIRQQQDLTRLNSLTRELMDIDETRPEPWMAVALFCDLKGDTMSALQFVCKAIDLDCNHAPAQHFKGALQLRMNQPELSVATMYKAYSLRRDLAAYKGLCNAYLAIPKVAEALRTAKEALQLMPKDPRAVLLVGRVLSQTPGEGRKKASKAYAKALKLDPLCFEAAIAIADLFLAQHQSNPSCDLQPAISVLTQTLQHQAQDFLHVKLGDLLTAAGDFGAALSQYHYALSINADFEAAKLGIERLEKLMRGLDPDAEEDYDLENEEYGEQQDM